MIQFENIGKKYKDHTVLHDVSFTINDGETVCLVGESGSGKTTLLKMINRLILPTSGRILINGQDIAKQDVLALRRNIGYVIQQTGLFPHMTIGENIEIIPQAMKRPPAEIRKRTLELLDMVGLPPAEYLDRYPSELSGGQQQRVGVARAFACDPDIILMDEPFSALDPLTRSALQEEVSQLQTDFKKTIVFVTHDMDEAVRLGDRICLIDHGRIAQYDTPENIMKSPANEFVSTFIGENRIWGSPELIKAEDIMLTDPESCSKDLSAFRALTKMRKAQVNSLMVIDLRSRQLLGAVTAKRLRQLDDLHVPVGTVMATDLITAQLRESIVDILQVVTENNLSYIPVVDETGRLQGLITQSSLVTSLSQQYLDDGEVRA